MMQRQGVWYRVSTQEMLAILKLDFSRAGREESVKIQESQEKGSRNAGMTGNCLERMD